MTSRSVVRLYSMTKSFVAAAVLQLVDDGLLGLDDRLADHVPAYRSMRVAIEGKDGLPVPGETVPARTAITIRHLLTHTSGISGHFGKELDGPLVRGPIEKAWAGL